MRVVNSLESVSWLRASFQKIAGGAYYAGGFLVGLKTRGLRRLVRYGTLNLMKRGLVDPPRRWADKTLGERMTQTLAPIQKKLAQALRTGIGRVLSRGRELAEMSSMFAVNWENPPAYSWRFDHAFCKVLGLGIVSKDTSASQGFAT